MEFNKLFQEIDKESSSNLTYKIGNPPIIKANNYFCLWSDLLGFGDMWYDCDWMPKPSQQKKIYERLQRAHSSLLYYSSPFEHDLILNDGIARVMKSPKKWSKHALVLLSLYLRQCIEMHISINTEETKYGYPGTRSVLAYGMGIEYLTNEVRFDDFVLNYSKSNGTDISNVAQQNGNPIVIYNPKELQMNTAFSKAYIIESLGSKDGVGGNNFFIDESFINAVKKIAKRLGIAPIITEIDGFNSLLFPYDESDNSRVYFGFSFSEEKPITIGHGKWTSKVFFVKRFYPHDENVNDFFFNLQA